MIRLQKLTDRELLNCHAEVKALQNQLGTSYKDASHRLYMAEVEKLEQQDVTLKTFATVKERMESNLQSFQCRFLGGLYTPPPIPGGIPLDPGGTACPAKTH